MKPDRSIACVLLVLAAACPGGTALPAAQVTVATYNVQNLFDRFDDPYREDETTPPKPEAALRALAAVIDRMDADILGLQEVENRGILERFNEDFLPAPYPHVVLIEGNDGRGIDVAVLSRLPVMAATSHRARTATPGDGGAATRFARDFLEVRLQATDRDEMTFCVCHFRSGHGDRAVARIRTAEASLARRIIAERLSRDPGALLVMAGDLNDTPDSRPLATLVGGNTPMLFDAAPPPGSATFPCRGEGSRIDYLLMSRAMKARYVRGSARVAEDRDLCAASDHRPVVATFALEGRPRFAGRPERPGGESGPGPAGTEAFAVVRDDDPPAARAVAATDLATLEQRVGKNVAVRGRLVRVAPSASGAVTFLDLARDYRTALSVVIFKKHRDRFPGLDQLVGRDVLIQGLLTTHKGRPQIVVENPSQIMLVREPDR